MYQAGIQNHYTAAEYTPFLFDGIEGLEGGAGLPPCTFGSPIIEYYGRADVRAALHIPESVQDWTLCTTKITLEYHRGSKGSQWVYEFFKDKDLKMLHFAGDVDGAVPAIGTERWIASMNWSVDEKWRTYLVDGQVAGYLERQGNLTFATVHGAGHMAPQFKPPETFHLISNWVKGADI